MMRGHSLQNGKNNINNMIMTNGNRNMRGTNSILKPDQRKPSGLAQHYLTFKLETPKIVTIKK